MSSSNQVHKKTSILKAVFELGLLVLQRNARWSDNILTSIIFYIILQDLLTIFELSLIVLI